MNEFFDFGRFRNYFISDLKSILAKNGITIIVFGMLPILFTLIQFAFNFSIAHAFTRSAIMSVVALVFSIWMPTACYGFITDKHQGTRFVSVPVSAFEKTLSMLLNMVVILPIAFAILYFLCDMLIVFIAGEPSDQTIFNKALTINSSDILFGVASYIFIFLTGAVYFRKSKIAKTMLVLMAIGIVVSILATSFIYHMVDNLSQFEDETWITNFVENLRLEGIVVSILIDILLSAAIYFRVKKIQY